MRPGEEYPTEHLEDIEDREVERLELVECGHLEPLEEIEHLEIGSLVSNELLAPVESEHLELLEIEHQELDQGLKRLVPTTPLHPEKAGLLEDRSEMRRKKQGSPLLGPLQRR